MRLRKSPLRLYVYPELDQLDKNPELMKSLQEHGKPQPAGGLLLTFDDADERREWRRQAVEDGVLCHFAPLPRRRQELWRAFMDGAQSPRYFRPLALALGPFWHLRAGLIDKFLVLAGAFFGLRALIILTGALAGAALPAPRLFSFWIELGEWRIEVVWGLIEHLALALYAGFYGEHDVFLRSIRLEKLWPKVPYSRFMLAAWALPAACLAAWFACSASTIRLYEDELKDGSRVSIRMRLPLVTALTGLRLPVSAAAAASISREGGYLDRAVSLFEAGMFDDAEGVLRARAEAGDVHAEYFLGKILIGRSVIVRKTGDPNEAAALLENAREALEAAARKGHPQAPLVLKQVEKLRVR